MVNLTLHIDEIDKQSVLIECENITAKDESKLSSIFVSFGVQSNGKNNYIPLDACLDFTRALRAEGLDVNPSKSVKMAFFLYKNIDLLMVKRVKESSLFEYQKEDAIWLASRKNALLANEMGTGKTLTTLMALPEFDKCRAIVVCPASLKTVWEDECKNWRKDLNPIVLSGKKSFRLPSRGELLIVNYEILPSDLTSKRIFSSFYDISVGDTYLIADEAHYLKSAKSQRSKIFRSLSREVLKNDGKVWLISGTPMMNNPLEMWNVLSAAELHSEAFYNWPHFVKVFNGVKNEWNAWKWGHPNPEAKELIKKVSCRRTRKEVLPDLPSKFYRKSKMTISREIKALCNRFINSLEGIEIDDLLERLISNKDEKLKFEEISEIRKELASAKTPYMLSLVETFEESQEPVVVFSAHTYPIEVLQKRKGWKVITGSTSNEDRTQAVKLFQEGKLKGIGATIKAGGVGLTLTNAHQAVFVDLDWTPAMNLQAEDRLCRIGQTKGVIINRIVADHILDQRIMSILIEKKKLLESVSLN